MGISGIGASIAASQAYTNKQTLPGSTSGAGASSAAPIVSNGQDETPAEKFMAYMKESPEQRFEDAWLTSHGISKAAFDAMSPEKRQAIMNEMKQDYERKIKEAAEQKSSQSVNILA